MPVMTERKLLVIPSLLWRSLFVGDIPTIENIIQQWGIAKENSELFASMTLLRPHRLRKNQHKEKDKSAGQDLAQKSTYEQQVGLKERIRSMLESEELIPRVSICGSEVSECYKTRR